MQSQKLVGVFVGVYGIAVGEKEYMSKANLDVLLKDMIELSECSM